MLELANLVFNKNDEDVFEFRAPAGITNRDGSPAMFKMRKLSQDEKKKASGKFTKRTIMLDKTGVPFSRNGEAIFKSETDTDNMIAYLIAESLIEPNLNSAEAREQLDCISSIDVVNKLFAGGGQLEYLIRVFNHINGFGELPLDADGNPVEIDRVKEIKN